MLEDKIQKKQLNLGKDMPNTAPEQSRRRLLKKTVAIPVIMTLSSGAALARSSNFAGRESSLNDAAGDNDNVYCMDHEGQLAEGAYDLGDHPTYTLVPRDTRVAGANEKNNFSADKAAKRQNLLAADRSSERNIRANEDESNNFLVDKATKRENLLGMDRSSERNVRTNEDESTVNAVRTEEDVILECDNRGGIFISSGAFASISGRTIITLRNL